MHVWSASCLPEKVVRLLEKLAELDPTRLVVTRVPGKQRQKIQYFTDTIGAALEIQKKYGGDVNRVTDAWKTPPAVHPPIRIRDRFLVVENGSQPFDPREIIIPAGLAFGTGDHPTTATCLRLLCDVVKKLAPRQKWSLLDVGTGSGMLAIAAQKLGASTVSAFDYDPFSISTSRENARLNGTRGIRWSLQDLLTFSPESRFDIVTANIFSELFIAGWPRIRKAIAPGGFFVLSGILRFQAEDCRAVLEKSKFRILRQVCIGKWVTFLAQSPVK